MTEIHALSGAYAVDALDDLERLRFEHHLAGCARCQEEVAGLREAAAGLAAAVEPVPPAPETRDAVLAGIRGIRQLPPPSPDEVGATAGPGVPEETGRAAGGRHAAPPAPRRRWVAWLAAAAAVVAVGAGAVVWQQLVDETAQVVSVADQVLQAPDAEEATASIDGGEATLVRSESEGRAVVITDDMPPPEEGSVYQLWLAVPDEGLVSAGLVPDPGQAVVLEGDAGGATAAGITIEPAGGSAAPTGDPIAFFEFDELEPLA